MPIVFVHGLGGLAERWGRNLDLLGATGWGTNKAHQMVPIACSDYSRPV